MSLWEPQVNTVAWGSVTATGWDQGRLDTAVVAHHEMHTGGATVLTNRQLSPEAIAEIYAANADSVDAAACRLMAASNPNTPAELAKELWVYAYGHGDMGLAGTVLTHPHLTDEAMKWFFSHGYVSALSNPGIDPDWLHGHRDADPWAVLNNPAVTARTSLAIHDADVDGLMGWACVPWLPLDHPKVAAALAAEDPNQRRWAYRHPGLNADTLRAAVERELAAVGPYSATVNELRARVDFAAPANAGDEVASLVAEGAAGWGPVRHTVRVELLEAAETSTAEHRQAARALLDAGFAGSVDELRGVAASVIG